MALSAEELRTVYFAVHAVTLSIVKTFGIAGNIATLVVISRGALKTIITPVLQALLAADLTMLLIAYPAHLYFGIKGRRDVENLDTFGTYYIVYVYYIATAAVIACSSWLVLMVAVYRYIATKYPFLSKDICSRRRSLLGILVIVSLGLLTNIPRLVTVPATIGATNVTSPRHDLALWRAIDITSLILAIVLPWVLCLIFMILAHRIVASSQETLGRRISSTCLQGGGARSADHQMAGTFTAILVLYLICVFPQAVRHIYRTSLGLHTWYNGSAVHIAIDSMADVALFTYYSVNFLLYTLSSEAFRTHVHVVVSDFRQKVLPGGATWSRNVEHVGRGSRHGSSRTPPTHV